MVVFDLGNGFDFDANAEASGGGVTARGSTTAAIVGSQGGDIIKGGDGADTISGDLGSDTLTGNGGADVFDYQAVGDGGAAQVTGASAIAAGGDAIIDFVSGTDKINFGSGVLDADNASDGVAQDGWDATSDGVAVASFQLDFTAGTTTASDVSTAIGDVTITGSTSAVIAIESASTAGSWNFFELTAAAGGIAGAAITLDGSTDSLAYLGNATVTGNSGNLAATDFTFV